MVAVIGQLPSLCTVAVPNVVVGVVVSIVKVAVAPGFAPSQFACTVFEVNIPRDAVTVISSLEIKKVPSTLEIE